jgi:PAS domain S-box-containing protein
LDIPAEPVTRYDGEVNLFNTVKSPIRDRDGRVRLTVGVSRNITRQKKTEEDLARHREHLEHLVTERTRELRELSDSLEIIILSLVEGIIAVDAMGHVKLMNPAAEALTGWRGAEAAGRAFPEILPLADEKTRLPLSGAANVQRLETMARPGGRLIAHLQSRDGIGRLVSVNVSRLIGADGILEGSVFIIRDVTVEREAEDQRLRHQKLESLGLLAGGIAHDFNNLLMGILGNISITRFQLETGSEMAATLEHAENACVRAQGLAKQLLTFSRGGAPVKKLLHLEAPVREAAELALRGSLVRLEIRASRNLHPVEADEGQLEQAVNNLVLNAKQAMPGSGSVVISIENVILAETDRLPLPPGTYVRTVVHDSGPGIPPEYLPKVFDPYFTTKEQGSGLGLASVHSIIGRHGGHVTVSSPPGAGACFTFYLPAQAETRLEPSVSRRQPASGGVKELLILDDDKTVLDVLHAMLAKLGHRVTSAGTSAVALAEFERASVERRPFDAVFVDLTMPGDLPGEEVISRLRAQDHMVKIVVMTGYSTNPLMADYQEHGLTGALAKPFNLEVLNDVLARV